MASKRITTGWRGFSLARETSYGNAATVDTAFNFEGSPTDIEINDFQTNEDEITGLNEPDRFEILNWKLQGTHSQRAMPHNLGLLGALVLGKVSTDQPDSLNAPNTFRHWIERDLGNVDLPSVTMVEYDGIGKKQYPGVYVKAMKLSGTRGGFLKMEGSFGGMGREDTSAIAKPAVVSESYLRYGDVRFSRGGSLTGTVAAGTLAVGAGGVSFDADLKTFEYSVANNALPIYAMGDESGYVTRVERGDRFTQSLSAVLEMQDDSHKTGLVSGSEYVLHIPIVGGIIEDTQRYTVELILPRVVYKEAKKDRDGHVVVVNAEFQILEDSTYGSVILKIINKQTGYLI